jgi:cation transport regulator ChaB
LKGKATFVIVTHGNGPPRHARLLGDRRRPSIHRDYDEEQGKDMSNYPKLEDLPPSIREQMPPEAQQLYLAAFRRKRETMKMSGEINEEALSEAAHEAGLFAVEQQFEKDAEGRWRQAPVGEEMDPDDLDFSENDQE